MEDFAVTTGRLYMGEIGVEAPLRLHIAARLAFPDGSMTTSGLRKERQRGRLVIERIAGKDYTTLGHIKRMRELCRLEAKVPGSICGAPAETQPAASRIRPFGSSATEVAKKAQDVLLMMLSEPSKLSRSISPASTPAPRENAVAIQAKSP